MPADAGGGVRGVAGGAGARAGGGGAGLGRADGARSADRGHVGRGRGVARARTSSPCCARRWTPTWTTSRWSRAAVGPPRCSTSSAPPTTSAARIHAPGRAGHRRALGRGDRAVGVRRDRRGPTARRADPTRPPAPGPRGGGRPGLRDGGAGGRRRPAGGRRVLLRHRLPGGVAGARPVGSCSRVTLLPLSAECHPAHAGRLGRLTVPAAPSTVTVWPVCRRVVASGTPTTAGMPYSRATTAPCEFGPAHLHHQPARGEEQRGPAGVGRRARRGSRPARGGRPTGSSTTRTTPVTVPADAGVPTKRALGAGAACQRLRLGAVGQQHAGDVAAAQLPVVLGAAVGDDGPLVGAVQRGLDLAQLQEEDVVRVREQAAARQLGAEDRELGAGVGEQAHEVVLVRLAHARELPRAAQREAGDHRTAPGSAAAPSPTTCVDAPPPPRPRRGRTGRRDGRPGR